MIVPIPWPTDIAAITGIQPWSNSDQVISARPMSPRTHAYTIRRDLEALSRNFSILTFGLMFPPVRELATPYGPRHPMEFLRPVC